jgi:VWFA-related protein
MTNRLFTLVVLALACPTAVVDGRRPQAIDLVHVDVAVLDRNGAPVRGLGPGDFEVLSEGERIDPAGFTPVEIARPPGAGAMPAIGQLAPRHVPFDVLRNDDSIDRYIVIVLDDLRGNDEAGAAWVAGTGLDFARAVVERLTPGDRGAVFFSGLGQRQGLTGHRDRLLRALEDFAARPVGTTGCAPAECLADTLQDAADILPIAPARRKFIVYISGGQPLPVIGPSGSRVSVAIDRLYRTLQRANAAVYSVSAPGVTTTGSGEVSLAEATGGRSIVGMAGRRQVDWWFDETGAYYLLSVPAPVSGSRALSVRTVRPDLRVHTRPRVMAPVETDPADSAGLTPLEAAIVAPRPEAELPLGVTVAPFASPASGKAVVSVVSAVTGARASGAPTWVADVAATAFDPGWQPHAADRQTIEVTPRDGAMRTQTVDVIAGLELLPGRYQVRVAAESGGRAGAVFVDLDVPAFDSAPLSVSGVVLTTTPVPYAASPLMAGTLPVTPTTRRLFRSDEAPEVFLRIYQSSRPRPVSVALRIGDAEGEGIIQGTEDVPAAAFDASGAADWRFVLPLDRLKPGEYLLTISVVLDGRTEVRHVRFAVAAPAAASAVPPIPLRGQLPRHGPAVWMS